MSRLPFLSLLTAILASCGGGESTTEPVRVATALTFIAGGGQTARIGTALPVAPVARLVDQHGQPMAGQTVTFEVIGGGGSLASTTVATGSDGTASAGTWTLGTNAGANTIQARVQGASTQITAALTATARLPRWTYMVYMAADNDLAAPGVEDIEEMEAAGSDPEVQVVIQAEFNPQEFALRGCGASCANLPNFNTFRYLIGPTSGSVFGPNGSVTDIGNRDMTDPAQLREFVQWAKSAYPAERYALVLWNHGGGYRGLLQDITSSPGSDMSLAELRDALAGTGELDLLNFDMCLMAGYETLVKLVGLAKVAVFSEENEPGDGDPYTEIIGAIQANPTVDAQVLGAVVVEAYHASYTGDASPTTKSAYDLASLAAFETALNALASTLTTNVNALSSALSTSAASSQKYSFTMLTDIVNFLDSLDVRTSDATLKSQIAAVRSAAIASGFRVANRARNGTHPDGNRVDRSSGLHILMPSGLAFDALPNSGPGSFSAYSALYDGKPWTNFLAAWLATTTTTRDYADQGDDRWQIYLVWDTASISRSVDVDLWILEPNGNLYVPFMGTVTPNGVLTDDSESSRVAYEGYLTNRYLEVGRYKFYANLYNDPQNHGPVYDVVYRTQPTAGFGSLYSPNFPRLTTETSWLDDPNATFADVEARLYTDLQYAAFLDVAPASAMKDGERPAEPFRGGRVVAPVFPRALSGLTAPSGESALRSYASSRQVNEPQVTPQQLKAVRAFVELRNKSEARDSKTRQRAPGALRTRAPALKAGLVRAPHRN